MDRQEQSSSTNAGFVGPEPVYQEEADMWLLPLIMLTTTVYKFPNVFTTWAALLRELVKLETSRVNHGCWGRFEVSCTFSVWKTICNGLLFRNTRIGVLHKRLKDALAAVDSISSILHSVDSERIMGGYVAASNGFAAVFRPGSNLPAEAAINLANTDLSGQCKALARQAMQPSSVLTPVCRACAPGCDHSSCVFSPGSERFSDPRFRMAFRESPQPYLVCEYILGTAANQWFESNWHSALQSEGYCYLRAIMQSESSEASCSFGMWPTVAELTSKPNVVINGYAMCKQVKLGYWHVCSSVDKAGYQGTPLRELDGDARVGGVVVYGGEVHQTLSGFSATKLVKLTVARKIDLAFSRSLNPVRRVVELDSDFVVPFPKCHKGSLSDICHVSTEVHDGIVQVQGMVEAKHGDCVRLDLTFDPLDRVVGLVVSAAAVRGSKPGHWCFHHQDSNRINVSFQCVLGNPVVYLLSRPVNLERFTGSVQEQMSKIAKLALVKAQL